MARVEVFSEIGVRHIRGVILLHKLNVALHLSSLPVPPEPLAAKSGHAEDAPVDEDAEFRPVVPLRQGAGVERVPVREVFCRFVIGDVVGYDDGVGWDAEG